MATAEELLSALRKADAAAQAGDATAAADARKLAALLQKKRAAESAAPAYPGRNRKRGGAAPKQRESTLSGFDQLRGAVSSFGQGVSSGVAGKLSALGRTAGEVFLEPESERMTSAPGSTYLDRTADRLVNTMARDAFGDYQSEDRALREKFNEESGGLGTVAELSGAALNPINYVAPQFGAGKTLDAAVRQVGRAGLESGIESGLRGEGDFVDDFTKGAVTGMGVTGALRGAGTVLSPLSNRRVAEDLVDKTTGQRKPLNLADEEKVAGAYRWLARVPGAHANVHRLEDPFVNRAREEMLDAAEVVMDRELAETGALKAAKRQLADRKMDLPAVVDESREGMLRQARQMAEETPAQEARMFSNFAATEALPTSQRGLLEGVDAWENPDAAREVLSNYWNRQAFGEVKQRTFPWEEKGAAALRDKIRNRMDDDPAFVLAMGDALRKVEGLEDRLQQFAGARGRALLPEDYLNALVDAPISSIDGDALMAMRNVFATAANGTSKNGYALRQVARDFDDFIRDNLDSSEARTLFNENVERYTKALSFMDATRGSAALERGGQFMPNEYMRAASKYGGKGMSAKKPPLVDEARSALQKSRQAAEALKDAEAQAAKAAKSLTRQQRKALAQEARALDDRGVAEKAEREAFAKEGPLGQARERAAALDKKLLPERTSPLSDLLLARTAGQMVTTMVPRNIRREAAIPAGIALGKMIGSNTFQDVLAGQTGFQTALREAIERGDTALISRLLARIRAGETAEN